MFVNVPWFLLQKINGSGAMSVKRIFLIRFLLKQVYPTQYARCSYIWMANGSLALKVCSSRRITKVFSYNAGPNYRTLNYHLIPRYIIFQHVHLFHFRQQNSHNNFLKSGITKFKMKFQERHQHIDSDHGRYVAGVFRTELLQF